MEVQLVIDEKFSELTDKMKEYIIENKLPSILALIYKDGKIAYCEKFGKADIGKNKEISLDTIFRIHSMTKPIVCVAALMLYEEGKFALHDPISNWLPEAKNQTVYAGEKNGEMITEEPSRPVTFFDLFTHTSGFVYPTNPNHAVDRKYMELLSENIYRNSLKEMVQQFFNIPLKFQPGTKWEYGNSIDILGYLVEVISGQTLDVFVEEQIFDKLGMKDSGFTVPQNMIHRFVKMYKIVNNEFVIQEDSPDKYTKEQKYLSGGGGMVSTLQDFLQFSLMLVNKGAYEGGRLLKEDTVELMMQDHISSQGISIEFEESTEDTEIFIQNYGFGLGVGVKKISSDGIPAGVSGWSGAATTDYWVDPENKVIGIFLSQFLPLFVYPVFDEFRRITYKGLK